MSILNTGIAAAFAATFFVGTAGAAQVTYFTKSSTITCSEIADVNPDASDCFGFTLENANAQQVDLNNHTFETREGDITTGLFGGGWTEFQSVGSVSGDQKTGSVNVDGNTYKEVILLLKSANSFAAYLYDDGLQGTVGFITGNDRGLSNWVAAGRGEMPPVPLPAAGWLLLAGLGGLAAMKRQKS